ncbi:hypothetical protein EPO33_01985 [Patescibacteria group bacterium]|nr:MAG: hypothetical protein EPO33_01985 [Patescibacteria group bacterium]
MNRYLQTCDKSVIAPPAASHARAAVFPHVGRFLPYVLATLVAALGVAYLIQLNVVAAQGFALRAAEARLADMKERNKKLQVELAQKESLAGMAEEIATLGMVPVHRVEYLVAPGGEVALR